MKTFAPKRFLEAWRILKTLLQSSFRSKSDKNQPSKFIHLGISPPVYYTHLDSCSKTAIQCKQLIGWNFSLRASNGKGPICDNSFGKIWCHILQRKATKHNCWRYVTDILNIWYFVVLVSRMMAIHLMKSEEFEDWKTQSVPRM